LRDRGMDILLLAEHFLRQACEQIHRSPCQLAVATHPLLLGNRWAGNVRQLQNVIFRAAATSEGDVIDCGDLELAGTELTGQKAASEEVTSLEAAVQGFEKPCWSVTTWPIHRPGSWPPGCRRRIPPLASGCVNTA
jgi:Transcriptional regulator of aromatic amino acids metabolism